MPPRRKAFLKGVSVDPACLTKVKAKFTTDVTKAEAAGVCTGTAAVLEDLVDRCLSTFATVCCVDVANQYPVNLTTDCGFFSPL